MTVEIRPATADDAGAVGALADTLGYPGAVEGLAGRLAAILGAEGHRVLVAVRADGTVVAWTHVFVTPRLESSPYAEVGAMVVAEGERGAGIGSRLLAVAEDWAAAQGVTAMRVRSRVARDGARAFYEARGYALTKEQRVFDKGIAGAQP
ncbi:MAG: GNAT family N-acetyltransferase [Halofilum sp. (in: g-proteobacteria)]|nr:GNAT family N-acetyltransferase [Halofilum sp. (in: g-proteobacteria)]